MITTQLIEVATVTQTPDEIYIQSQIDNIKKQAAEISKELSPASNNTTTVPMLIMGEYIFNVNSIQYIKRGTTAVQIVFDTGADVYVHSTDIDVTWDALIKFAGAEQ